MPPGVYVKGFLSFVIIAFCTHEGISAFGGCGVTMRRVGIDPLSIGGVGGAELNERIDTKNVFKFISTFASSVLDQK